MLNPPADAVVERVAGQPNAWELRWRVSYGEWGHRPLYFRVEDEDAHVVTVALPVRILGRSSGERLIEADVSGDGVLDIIAVASGANAGGTDRGAIYVWEGGSASPTATLTVPGASDGDRLGASHNGGLVVADVTGDGVDDIIGLAQFADVGGTSRGAVYVWQGGASLTGSPAPLATLTDPAAKDNDQLGSGHGATVQCVSVDGDGTRDVVVTIAKRDGDRGGVLVWRGGATLQGTPTPLATLAVPGAAASDNAGYGSGQGTQVFDVTGDGHPDILVSATSADLGGTNRGAIYVWRGGSGLNGALAPAATLSVPGAADDDYLGAIYDQGLHCVDVTGDGLLDIVSGSGYADLGGTDRGAIYIWNGSATLAGNLAPSATLTVAGAMDDDHMAGETWTLFEPGLLFRDLDADGRLDIIGVARMADHGGTNTGAMYFWRGGSTLTGALQPAATLSVPGAANQDQLGAGVFSNGWQRSVRCCDVSGDGIDDLIAVTIRADVGGTDRGAVYVWKGQTSFSGARAPDASLVVAGAADGDRLGNAGSTGLRCHDVTGDGVLDLVVAAEDADAGGQARGAIYVWAGGGSLQGSPAPRATLTDALAQDFDRLASAGATLPCMLCSDVTGDGLDDIVCWTFFGTDAATGRKGSVRVFAGGVGLTGDVQPTARLLPPGTVSPFLKTGQSVQCADLDGDGLRDIVVSGPLAAAGGTARGALWIWKGGATLAGTIDPAATLTVADAKDQDQLGGSGLTVRQHVRIADIDGDGQPDVIAGTPGANLAGSDRGAVYSWLGGSTLVGARQPDVKHTVPNGSDGDGVG
jgi:hypothetical protein